MLGADVSSIDITSTYNLAMNPEELLKDCLKELNLPCSEEHVKAFMVYLSDLKKWNRAYSLTALTQDRDIIIKHFLDSLLYLRLIPDGQLSLADIGSGAGFPGIPLKIVRPELNVALVEPSKKKAAFLRTIIRNLKLSGITVCNARVENLDDKHIANYDVVVSRATFSIVEFLGLACPLANNNGVLIISKGPKVSGDLVGLEHSPHGEQVVNKMIKLQLPYVSGERNLVSLSCKMKK